jgi:hypothetical protein
MFELYLGSVLVASVTSRPHSQGGLGGPDRNARHGLTGRRSWGVPDRL